VGGAPTANPDAYYSNVSTKFSTGEPGVLANDHDPDGHPMTAVIVGTPNPDGSYTVDNGFVKFNADGSFTAWPTTPPTGNTVVDLHFTYNVLNSQGLSSAQSAGPGPADVDVFFNGGSGLVVKVLDAPSAQPGNTPAAITDYRWIIEEDRTTLIDPNAVTSTSATPAPTLGTNFHTSYMPVIASGCVSDSFTAIACETGQSVLDPVSGTHMAAVCDIGDGICRTDAASQTPVLPSQVHLDPTKRYYISILSGDSGNSFESGSDSVFNAA